MEKLIKIISSPVNPSMEIVNNIVINLHVPYSKDNVTVKIDPNIQEYKENDDKPDIQVSQIMISVDTAETKNLKFDFNENKTQKIKQGDEEYEITLMHIGEENVEGIEGQKFPYFEFLVKW